MKYTSQPKDSIRLGNFTLNPAMLCKPENSEVVTNGFGKLMDGLLPSTTKDSVDCQGPPVAPSPNRPGHIWEYTP